MTDILIKFTAIVIRPDQRQYRQQEIEMVCQHELEVPMPLINEYVANSEKIIQWQLGTVHVLEPNPILTVAGLKYVIDQFDNVFLKVEEKEVAKTDDEDWGEEETEKKAEKLASKVEDEDWEESPDPNEEVPWDSDDEKWL